MPTPYDAEQIYSAMLATDEAGQKKLFALLMDAQLSGQTEGKPFADLDQLINDLLTDEEREELYKQAIRENGIPEEADPNNTGDTDPRAFHVEIGVSTGNTTIYNDGDIMITVNGDSDLTAENIQSERGDVSVEVQNGSILSAGTGANITGENVSLSASENIGTQDKPVNVEQVEEEPNVTVTVIGKGVAHSETITDPEGNEKTIWVMDVELRYDWARTDDAEATKRLDAEAANGDIFLAEQTGNTGLGILTGAGTVSVQTAGSITDVRTDAEKAAGTLNITAEEAVVIALDHPGDLAGGDAAAGILLDVQGVLKLVGVRHLDEGDLLQGGKAGQDGAHLLPGQEAVRLEGVLRGAADQTLLIGPAHCVVKRGILLHVGEGGNGHLVLLLGGLFPLLEHALVHVIEIEHQIAPVLVLGGLELLAAGQNVCLVQLRDVLVAPHVFVYVKIRVGPFLVLRRVGAAQGDPRK